LETALLEIREEGMLVELMDGSTWTINAENAAKTIKWRPIQRIVIEVNRDEICPYSLTNLDTPSPEKVKASRFL